MKRVLLSLSLLLISLLAISAGLHYKGSLGAYLLFTLITNALLLNGFKKRSIYFDTFIGVFIWLGFWLKFSVRLAFFSGEFHEAIGAFDGAPESFDNALNISSCGIAAFWLASVVRQRFFNYPDAPLGCGGSGIFRFYKDHRKLLVGLFVVLVALVAISNAWFGVYQRGMVTQTVLPFGMNGIYKWLLQFGFASVSALIIRFEIELNQEISWVAVLPPLFEAFSSNVSLLSRGMVLNSVGLVVGAIRTMFGAGIKFSPLRVSAAALMFAALFAVSVFAVNYLRSTSLLGGAAINSSQVIGSASGMATPLFLDRWVGIEGVMAVSSSKHLGWELWREALGERFQEGQLSFYDRVFIESPYLNYGLSDSSKHHFVSLPGVVAFFYYPGSLFFLFLALFLLGLVAAIIECLTYLFAGLNWVLCSLFAQVVAFRYVSFGYVPGQSYLLFGALALNVLLIYAVDRVLAKHYS